MPDAELYIKRLSWSYFEKLFGKTGTGIGNIKCKTVNKYNHSEVEYPKIFLAIDNCFASKRYTLPHDWMKRIRDLGIFHVEASADTECDPLYMGRDYLKRWADAVAGESLRSGVKVCNLYSGHGTYSTLGLSHTDPSVRKRILNQWLKPMVETAALLNAGLGFFCHAFSDRVLQDPQLYHEYDERLTENLAEVAQYAAGAGCESVGIEQMYSPHQVPWTISGAKALISRVSRLAGSPFYLTIDTGHQTGQQKFRFPGKHIILDAMEQYRSGKPARIWLGPDTAFDLFEGCRQVDSGALGDLALRIIAEAEKYPYLFCRVEDGSTHEWLKELGGYAPIIHLQQTDGSVSAHWPFTRQTNEKGIVDGREVLASVKAFFDKPVDPGIPRIRKIYMTIEVFASTASINRHTIGDLRETVEYWRKLIPEDGCSLDDII